ncbi:MAG: hypothetical protein ACRCXB_22950 [Aeromonadaceae bacterium]
MQAKQPMKTPVRGTCIRTGQTYDFPSMAAVALDDFSPGKVRDCVRGRAKTHAGMTWKAMGPLRPAREGYGNRTGEAASLYNSGKTYAQVAEAMGISITTARYYVNASRAQGLVTRKG